MEKENVTTIKPKEVGPEQIKISWDMIKVPEPNGSDKLQDERRSHDIIEALARGFEPFAVMPTMERKSAFSGDGVITNWIYMKRPSFTSMHINDPNGKVPL